MLTEIPRFLPRIPYVISLSNSSLEADLDEKIQVSGSINPPLKIFELRFRYDGPNMRVYEKTLNTDTSGIFIDEFTPPLEGLWNISLSFEESEYYTYELNHQVLVNTTENMISSEQNFIPITDETVYNESEDDETGNNEGDDDETIESNTQSDLETPKIDDDSFNDIDSSIESNLGNETEENEIQVVSYSEEETQVGDPLIFGFIPSILIVIIMVAIYIGTNKLK